MKFNAQCCKSAIKGYREARETSGMYSVQAVITCTALKNGGRAVDAGGKGIRDLSKINQPLIEARRELILSSETTE